MGRLDLSLHERRSISTSSGKVTPVAHLRKGSLKVSSDKLFQPMITSLAGSEALGLMELCRHHCETEMVLDAGE